MTLGTEMVFGYTNDEEDYTRPPWGAAVGGDKTAVLGEYLYYMTGGDGQNPGKGVYRSKNGTTWETVTTTPEYGDRWNFQVLAYDGKLWVLGGDNGSAPKRDVWYSTTGLSWTQATAAAAWSARWGFGACVYAGKMWVAGGGTAMGPGSNVVRDLYYSMDGITWTAVAGTPGWVARWGHILAPVSDGLVVIGGYNASGVDCADGWKTTNSGATWTLITPEVTDGAYLDTGTSPWTEGALTDFKHRCWASATYDEDGNLWMAGGTGSSSRLPRGIWHTMDGVYWRGHTESPNVGMSGERWWDRMLPGYWGTMARFRGRLYYFQGIGYTRPDDYDYYWSFCVWRTALHVPGEGASLSMVGQSNVCLGCVGGFWSRQNRQTPLYNAAVASGTATGGGESALQDTAANFGATLGTNGYEVIVVRDGWAPRRADVVARASGMILMVGDWFQDTVAGTPLASFFCVRRGDWYMVAPRTAWGVVTSGETRTLTDENATFPDSGTDGGLVGARVTVLQNTDRTMQTRLIVGSVKATGVLTVDRVWDRTPVVGDFYIIGGHPWRFRTGLIYPPTGTLIRGKKLKISMRGAGISLTKLVWVKVFARGASYGVPEFRHLQILDPFGVSPGDRLELDWINLPLKWGRRWQLEVGGLSLEQEIQVSRIEIVMEEQ